ncbi:hypothetical protein [Nitrosomonas communis]|nr:hypothetical protein [Nitrosomonas communis]
MQALIPERFVTCSNERHNHLAVPRRVISNLKFADSGKFYAFDGQIVP